MRSNLRIFIAVASVVVLGTMAAVYYFFDPSEVRWMPRCLWRLTTGTDCPGCGSQRMVHALMHGDIAAAWRANAYALCMLPAIAFLIFTEFTRERYPRLYGRVHSRKVILGIAGSIFVWWIIRNFL